MGYDEKAWEIIMEAYREMYKKSVPSADWDKMIESGEAKKRGFFDKYHLPKKMLDEIIERNLKESKLPKWMCERMRVELYLGSAPCTCEGENQEHKESK